MHCPACKTHNSDTNRYCENCGGALGPVCAHCGRENGRNAKFCGHCGSGLAVLSTLPTSDSANSPAGGASISRGGDPRQELKIATVLFADIANSTEEVAQLGAEEAMQRLQPVVRQMCTPVERYGGTVVRTLGDGIMALFGAPMALEGHVRLACEAALRIQGIFENEDWKLGVRVGLHTGQVASDPTVGLSARSDGVHGLTIHLANRVMASAEPGEIRITQATQELAADSYEFRAVGLTALRGIAVPQALFTLLGARRAQDLQLRRNTRAKFHGRIEEMKQLQASLALAQEGRARVIGISGEPGAGKSRLCAEFASWCRERGATVHEIRSQLYGHAAPLQPVLELFRQAFFGIGDADDPETVRSKIARCLAQCDQDHAFTVDPGDEALLAEFIGLATAEDTSQAVTATFRRGRLLALARQLVRLPRDGVSLILLEDLHWLDEPSLEFLSELVASVEGTRVLLLLNYRPNFSAEWQGNPNYEHIRLEGLANEVVEQIVQDLTNYQLDLSDVRELIIRRSGGNPLFAEELVRALNEDLISVGAPKPQYRIEILERSLPFSVQSIIGARIDRLDPSDKSLLQMCSVVGKDIPRLVLEHIAAEEVHGDITKALGRLCAADFIQRNADEDRFEYSFRHPLIQEVAYETQLRARRSAMHEVVATVMEKHYAGRGKEFSA
ncbi:MAG: AAA family ATPase, partial [Proteobacteria bacterium]|nr:AAA family ATPase [Pseudomonadota bacterium]